VGLDQERVPVTIEFNMQSNEYSSQLNTLLAQSRRVWLVTGTAGFIGSNLVESLLRCNQRVVGLDNYATGHRANLEEVKTLVGPEAWSRFEMLEGDICDPAVCQRAVAHADVVLHQAALGSVPRSLIEPVASHASNVTGFVNLLWACKEAGIRRFVYASSSAVYGDHPALPKREEQVGACLSPYAATKAANELYANVFARCYGLECIGLRYFNVFGPRQDPNGAYAAVIPKWIQALIRGEPIQINGDGETSRDFCYVANVVQANLRAALISDPAALNQAYNVAVGDRTTLNQLFEILKTGLLPRCPKLRDVAPVYADFRAGDVRHSEADISKARNLLGYEPTHCIGEGMEEALDWYVSNLCKDQ